MGEHSEEIISQADNLNEFVNETLDRKEKLKQLRNYIVRQQQKAAAVCMEKMIITAFQSNATPEVIEAMCKNAGMTESRLAKLKKQTGTA